MSKAQAYILVLTVAAIVAAGIMCWPEIQRLSAMAERYKEEAAAFVPSEDRGLFGRINTAENQYFDTIERLTAVRKSLSIYVVGALVLGGIAYAVASGSKKG
ncbi:MAG: hypothetical protein C4551_02360 [Bacillota bacterium]|nr:MAG: hypothetical protein C4551_02360 [Bacillota bacterium]